MDNRRIIIFDGVCNFCNGAVNFIIKRDPGGVFVFTPMQSDIARSLIEKYQVPEVGVNTFLLIKDNECYMRTNAALEIAKELSGQWYLFAALKVLPVSFRDYFYKLFARNRYKLFGKREVCMMPTPDKRSRFID
ncbi:DCC1-like thiol-disulfide oxidoreductase family protein [uncultured Paraglaciecola sp.]|uniref:thiol-disulfide oxidoreductase DCC family protein n=1 Tax=uncultured Paraglaciecola sp. TaxID=1765024 RepID=UPI0030DCD224|tara:strand:+ start:3863 stop:4264 length:402 start_codon:yes stop_codon:yes gene_type:complete